MTVLTLSNDFFTSFVHIPRLGTLTKKKKQKIFVEIVAVCRALLDYNLFITK